MLVVPKLDRIARSVPDAGGIGDSLAARGGRLSLGGTIYDPRRPDRQVLLQHPGHVRGVRGRSAADAHPGGHGDRPRERKFKSKPPKLVRPSARCCSSSRRPGSTRSRACRAVLRQPRDRLPRTRSKAPAHPSTVSLTLVNGPGQRCPIRWPSATGGGRQSSAGAKRPRSLARRWVRETLAALLCSGRPGC